MQVFQRRAHLFFGGVVMAFDRDQRLGGILTGGALIALPPTPAPRADQFRLVHEDHFAGFGVDGLGGAEIR